MPLAPTRGEESVPLLQDGVLFWIDRNQANPIRVLRQPFFEALCAFILSQNNNIGRITGSVARLCALCGAPAARRSH